MKKIILFSALLFVLPFTSTTVHYVRADVEDYREVNAVVTAYTASPDETDGDPSVTASGRPTVKGIVACPRSLSFGTKVEIEGVRYDCQDRMNARYTGNHFDVLVENKNQAFQWGRKRIIIKIYN